MEISIKNGEMTIIKTKESDITLHYSEKDKHSMNSFKSITSIEQQYNAMKRTKMFMIFSRVFLLIAQSSVLSHDLI